GSCISTLCVIDKQPRKLSQEQRESLQLLARVASRALEGRRALLAERQALAAVSEAKKALQEKHAALLQSERLLKRTGEIARMGGWRVDLLSGEIRWSEETARIHGMPAAFQPQFERAIKFYVPEARPVIEAAVELAIQDGTPWDLELQIVRADGVLIWVRSAGEATFSGDRAIELWGTFQDITAVKQLRERLDDQHERLRVTLHSIADAVICTNAEGLITSLNPAAEQLTGWLAGEAEGQELERVFHIVHAEAIPLMDEAGNAIGASAFEAGESSTSRQSGLLISRSGSEFGIDESISMIRTTEGVMLGTVIVFRDVSAQRRQASDIQYRATHDALTGLVNRAEFEARLTRVLTAAKIHQSEHVMLFIDLDRFKQVNDACGHAAGDLLLQQISKLLARSVRSRDTLARLGGDEFALLLNHCSLAQAQRIAQQICDGMDDFRFLHGEQRFRLGTSIGMVSIDAQWTTIAQPLQAADAACYEAKETGRNRVCVWHGDKDSTGAAARRSRAQWAERLEQALHADGFHLFAQRIEPACENEQGLFVEVLLRLADKDGSFLAPGAFLPEAQRFHLSKAIDAWVLQKTINWLESLGTLDAIRMVSINLSVQSIVDPDFQRKSMALLAMASPSVASRLCLEIPEQLVVSNLADAVAFVEKVNSFGVRTAIDDFGSEATSFSYLNVLPVDVLKIDGQFIRNMADDPLTGVAVRHFVEVARISGKQITAKCVERADLPALLRQAGVNFLQGYFIHAPQAIETTRTRFCDAARSHAATHGAG
ncbi:MAG: EAL domain-containing protein, partial [Janthinobacterium lividum]